MNHFYKVTYSVGGNEMSKTVESSNAGSAFAEILKANHQAVLIKAVCEGVAMGGYGHTEYLPPPVQRAPLKVIHPSRPLRKNEKGCEFPFYDEVKAK